MEGEGGRRGFKHGDDIYSGGERLGDALQILADSVIVSHVAWHGKKSWIDIISSSYQRGDEHCKYLGRCLWSIWSALQMRIFKVWKDASDKSYL